MRALLAGGGVLLLLAISLTVVTVGQTRRLGREARVATARGLAAAAVANLDVDPERSILLALESVDTTRATDGTILPEAEEAIHRAIQRSRIIRTVPQGNGLAVSPDGRWFGTTGDGAATIWTTDTGRRLLTLHYDEWVNNIAVSPDGRRVATTHGDGTAAIWNATSGRRIHLLQAHEGWAMSPQFSPDSKALATTGGDGAVRLWDADTGAERMTLTDDRGPTFSPRFNRNGSRLVVANADNTAQIWNTETGEPTTLLEGHTAAVGHTVFSPDGTRVATGGADGTVRIANADTGELLMTLFTGNAINCVDYTADGQYIAAGGDDGTAVIWDAATGQQVLTLPAHTSGIISVAFTPDGSRLLTTGRDPITRIWDVSFRGGRDWLTMRAPRIRLTGVAFSPDSRTLASPHDKDGIVLRDTRSGATVRTLVGSGSVQNVVFSPDGSRIAGTVYESASIAHTTDISAVAIWDVHTGELTMTLRALSTFSTNVVFSPDGSHLVIGARDEELNGTVTVWDTATGTPERRLRVEYVVQQVAFSPDGRYLAVAGEDVGTVVADAGNVTVWDANSWHRLQLPVDHNLAIASLAFTPNGHLLTGSFDGTAKLWDVATGDKLMTLRGHAAGVSGVAVSPDGSRLATASEDRTVKLWDAETGRLQLTLYGHERQVYTAAFSPDGRLLASASPDGLVMLHLLPIDEVLKVARSRLTRGMTSDECHQYLQAERCSSRR